MQALLAPFVRVWFGILWEKIWIMGGMSKRKCAGIANSGKKKKKKKVMTLSGEQYALYMVILWICLICFHCFVELKFPLERRFVIIQDAVDATKVPNLHKKYPKSAWTDIIYQSVDHPGDSKRL